MDNPFVKIEIQAVNETKTGLDSAINDTVESAHKLGETIQHGAEETAQATTTASDKIRQTGQAAESLTRTLLTSFGVSSEKASIFANIIGTVTDSLAAAKAAEEAAATSAKGLAAANTTVAASEAAVVTGASLATAAVTGLTAVMLANPITAILVLIAAAVAGVAVAFDLWPKSTANVEELNKKLKEHLDLIDKVLGETKARARVETNTEELESRRIQHLELKRIKEIDSIKAAEEQMRLSTEMQDKAEAEKGVQEGRLRVLVEQLATLKEQRDTQHLTEKNSFAGLQNAQEIAKLEETINEQLRKHVDYDKQAANFRAQAEAAQDRALALPDILKKKEAERIKDKTAGEDAYAGAIVDMNNKALKEIEKDSKEHEKRTAKERLKLYGDMIDAMNDERKKLSKEEKEADKAAEKAIRDEKRKEEKEERKAEKEGPKFIGLEELGKTIQLAALKPSKEQADRDAALAESRKAAAATAELLEVTKKASAIFEIIADETGKTAEKIDKVGTLA